MNNFHHILFFIKKKILKKKDKTENIFSQKMSQKKRFHFHEDFDGSDAVFFPPQYMKKKVRSGKVDCRNITQSRVLHAHVAPEANAALKIERFWDVVRDDCPAGPEGLILHEGRARGGSGLPLPALSRS